MTPIHQFNPYVIPGLTRETIKMPEVILAAVCRATGQSAILMKTKSRKMELVQARHLYIYFLKSKTTFSLNTIGSYARNDFDPMDHTSVLHAIQKINTYIEIKDKSTIALIDKINKLL